MPKPPQSHNRQTEAYKTDRPLKHHQLRMLDLVAEEVGAAFSGRLLDVGCADGSLLSAMRQRLPAAQLAGIDLAGDLIDRAATALGHGVALQVADAYAFKPAQPHDVVVASSILSVFDDPYPVLERWLSWLAPRGKLFVFGHFSPFPADVVVKFRSHHRDNGWETGFAWFWTDNIARFLSERGYRSRFEAFKLPIDLERTDDPVRQYTMRLANDERAVVNDLGLILRHHFLVVTPAASMP